MDRTGITSNEVGTTTVQFTSYWFQLRYIIFSNTVLGNQLGLLNVDSLAQLSFMFDNWYLPSNTVPTLP